VTRSTRPRTAPVRILLFAAAREAAGAASLPWAVPPSGTEVGTVLRELGRGAPDLARVLKDCRIARNGRYVRGSAARVRPGDELAIHPPFSGG
jgi:molybdopterin converting factor small subunit